MAPIADTKELRILDISGLNFEDCERVEKLVAQLSEACEGPGFFLLKVGSQDFSQLCVKMLECAKEVFPLPIDEKNRLINDSTSQMHYLGDYLLGMTNIESSVMLYFGGIFSLQVVQLRVLEQVSDLLVKIPILCRT